DADLHAEAAQELQHISKALSQLETVTLLSGEYDEREAVVTIRAGAGGVDAADFTEMLMRMYLRWAEHNGYPTKVMDNFYAEAAGVKSATSEESASDTVSTVSVESGALR